MQPTQTQPTALDPQVVNLTKAIRQTESGGNFQAVGKSGEYGAYQFEPSTWNAASAKYGVNVPLNQATPEQQNEVAYKQVAEWKNAGYNVGQIASMWNAGESKPNAYLDGNSGTNSSGVAYDTPTYAKNVATAYQQFKSQSGNMTQPTSNGTPDNSSPSVGGFLGNVVSSAGNVLGGLGNAVMHPIQTAENLGNTAVGAGENLLNATGATNFDNTQTQTADNVGQYFAKRYGGSNPLEIAQNVIKTAYTDPVGTALDLSTLIDGVGAGVGLAGKIGDIAKVAKAGDVSDVAKIGATTPTLSKVGQIGQTIGNVGDAVNPINALAKGAGAVVSGATRLTGETLGIGTGAGYGAIKEFYNSILEGGDAAKSATEGLRGASTPEEIVTQAKDALGDVSLQRSQGYRAMLSSLKTDSSTYDISPILKQVENKLNEFGVTKTADGTLDFSRSAIGDGSDAAKIEQIYNDVKNWGLKSGDRTAVGLDVLKRRIGNYFSPNSDIRSFVTGVKSSVKNVLEKAPGYSKAMKDYADMSENIDDIRRGLSLNDKASVETSYKKLISSLRQNNEYRKSFVQSLDQSTGGTLLPKIAGQQLHPMMPQGLTRYTDEGLAGAAALLHTPLLPIMTALLTTSPRLVGESLRGLALTEKNLTKLGNIFSKVIPASKVSAILNIARGINESQKGKDNKQ